MFPAFLPAQHKGRKGRASSLALAIALAGAGILGAAGVAEPAYAAKEKQKEGKADYSPTFVKAYQPMSEANSKATDAAGAEALRGMIPGLVEAIKTDDDKLAGGQLILNIGGKLKDPTVQRQGLMLQLESGKVPDEQVATFNYYVGSLSWDMKDYANARTYLKQAIDAGHTGDNIERLYAETFFAQNQNAEGLAALHELVAKNGKAIPEDTFRRALQVAYEAKMTNEIANWAADLVRYHPSPETWNTSLAVVGDSYGFAAQETLDLMRLMKRTNALLTGREYVDYIEAADPRRMSNEVLPLIDEAVSKGLIQPSDVFLQDAKTTAQGRSAADRSDAPQLAKDARTAKDGVPARAAGDNFMSLGDAASAEEMYKLALQKGNVETDRVTTRLGIVQADQGKFDEARATFQQITGVREPIAKMWLAYIDSKAGGTTAAAPAPAAQ